MPSLKYQYSDVELILGHDCFHAIRTLEIFGEKSRISPFLVRLPIDWVHIGPRPSPLHLPSHFLKCSVEDTSLIEQVKNWYELES